MGDSHPLRWRKLGLSEKDCHVNGQSGPAQSGYQQEFAVSTKSAIMMNSLVTG